MSSTITLAAGVGQFTAGGVTTTGFALGLALLGTEHWRWYRGSSAPAAAPAAKGKGKAPAAAAPATKSLDPKVMIPYWFGMISGILAVGCPAGLLGYGAAVFRWAGNGVGGMGMSWLTGQAGTALAAGGTTTKIDGFGAVLITALFVSLWWLRKQIPKTSRGRWWKGAWTGVLLCITTGTAAVISALIIGSTNDLGRLILDTVAHGKIA